jgi:hypothetical protein
LINFLGFRQSREFCLELLSCNHGYCGLFSYFLYWFRKFSHLLFISLDLSCQGT